jgi:DNA-binding transcriptional MerR regulator
MEDNKEFNIYYQYNTQNEVDNPELLGDNNFLTEYHRNYEDNLNFIKFQKLLEADGVDLGKIKQILIEENKGSKHKLKLNPLSEANFNDYKNRKNIYIHLVLKEEECSKNNIEQKEIEAYNIKITELGKKFKSISEEMKKIKNSNILSEANIADIINNDYESEEPDFYFFLKEKLSNNNLIVRKSFMNIMNMMKQKTNLYVLYLFCSVFDLKKISNEESDYYEEIECINNVFHGIPNLSATFIVEPIINLINNFNIYFGKIPDIIHININANSLYEELNYNNLGETIKIKLEDFLKKLGSLKEISNIKLLGYIIVFTLLK